MPEPSFFEIATQPTVAKRAFVMAVIVGTILMLINHFNCCLMKGTMGWVCFWKVLMTFCVPYTVSTISSVQAIRYKSSKGD